MKAPAPPPGWLEGEPLGPVDAVLLAGLCLCAAALHFALAPGHADGSVVLGVGFGLIA